MMDSATTSSNFNMKRALAKAVRFSCFVLGACSLIGPHPGRVVAAGSLDLFVDGQLFSGGAVTNGDAASIVLETSFSNGQILFTLDGSPPTFASAIYTNGFTISFSATVRAIAYSADFSEMAEAGPVVVVIVPTFTLTAITPGGGTISTEPTNCHFAGENPPLICGSKSPTLRWV